MPDVKKPDPVKAALEQARKDHERVGEVCADMNAKATEVLARLRKRVRPVRLVKANHG